MARNLQRRDPRIAVANGVDRARRTRSRESVLARAQARKERRGLARADDEAVDEFLREPKAGRVVKSDDLVHAIQNPWGRARGSSLAHVRAFAPTLLHAPAAESMRL